ncbi:FecR family protein [Sphaerotilus sp.]|uniref:FecR family protein n=1 Tax=Sphaerotilus sp. TaxID=2093942 RepID=UPI002ACE779B|nr:FecR domain-containing protein [Sphaerotilus sp.]MDZ7855882.1 FecR domain-containing protein [Sphaerotilus sp.]
MSADGTAATTAAATDTHGAAPASTPRADVAANDALAPYDSALRAAFPDREALLAEARTQTRQQQRQSARRRSAAGSALAIALLSAAWLIDPAWRSQELRTAIGERSTVTLSDGSQVQLNTGSVLRVQSHLRSRQLTLVQGEALFTVSHGWRPFIVHAPGATIRDIGTVFNVRQSAAGLQVTVVDGAVEVSRASATETSTPQEVRAGQVWSSSGTGTGTSTSAARTQVAAADATTTTAWRHGKLVFDGTPLSDALAEVQRYRRAPIRVADPAAARMRISGEYDLAGIEALIDALPATLPVRVERAADGSVSVVSRR